LTFFLWKNPFSYKLKKKDRKKEEFSRKTEKSEFFRTFFEFSHFFARGSKLSKFRRKTVLALEILEIIEEFHRI